MKKRRGVFDDPHGKLFSDIDHSADEERFVLIGMSAGARLLIVVHCYRERQDVVRTISARTATRKEAQVYAQGI